MTPCPSCGFPKGKHARWCVAEAGAMTPENIPFKVTAEPKTKGRSAGRRQGGSMILLRPICWLRGHDSRAWRDSRRQVAEHATPGTVVAWAYLTDNCLRCSKKL